MRVDGQLEGVQLEEISSASPTPAARSRIYSDISTPASAVPKFYTGSSWLPLRLGQTDPMYNAGNSGKAITIDWNNGLVQKVTLSDGCSISFSNMREGEVHVLIVKQPEYSVLNTVLFPYNLDMPDQDSGGKPYQPVGLLHFGQEVVHSWYGSGDTDQEELNISDAQVPGSILGTANTDISPDPYGKYLYVGSNASPYLGYYSIFGKDWLSGVNIATPTALAAATVVTAIHPTGRYLFVGTGTTPYINMRGISPDGNPTTAYSNPGTLPGAAITGVDVHPNGNYVACTFGASPYTRVYAISPTGFGSATTPTLPGNGSAVAWSKQGDYIAYGHASGDLLTVYSWPGLVAVPAPATLPAQPNQIIWRPQGDWIAVVQSGVNDWPYVVQFDRAAGAFGTVIMNDDWNTTYSVFNIYAAGNADAMAWSPCGNFLVIGHGVSPWISIIPWTDAGPDTSKTVSIIGAVEAVAAAKVAVSPCGDFLYVTYGASPYFRIYNMPKAERNYIKL